MKIKKHYVNQYWLQSKIEQLNNWLSDNPNNSEVARVSHSRNYHVNKLIELDESNYNVVQI